MIRLLILMLLFTLSAPAEADVLRASKRIFCRTVAIITFPVLAPLNYVAQTALVGVCYSRGDWHTAAYLIDGRVYDWHWLENY